MLGTKKRKVLEPINQDGTPPAQTPAVEEMDQEVIDELIEGYSQLNKKMENLIAVHDLTMDKNRFRKFVVTELRNLNVQVQSVKLSVEELGVDEQE